MHIQMTILNGIINAVIALGKHLWLKIYAAIGLISLDFFFDLDKSPLLWGLLILIIIDFITAIYATIQNKQKIESKKVAKTAGKTAVYFLLISAAFISEGSVPIEFLDDTIIAFLTLTELISIVENAAKAGIAIPKTLYDKLKEYQNK